MREQLSFLSSCSAGMGIHLHQEALRRFEIYLKELKAWNQKFNLTAIKEDKGIVIKLFLDSLTPFKLIKTGSMLLDIGSGAGFPGIPLHIADPSLHVTLLDSVNKKVTFMNHIIAELSLTGIEAIHRRAEEFAKTKKGDYDVVISRALTNLSDFIKLGEPFLKHDGILIAMKGSRADEEIRDAAKVLERKKMKVKDIIRFCLPFDYGKRGIVVLSRSL